MALYAPRYARALADLVRDGRLDASLIDRELASFLELWRENHELRGVFTDPSLAAKTKVAILDKLAPRLGLSATTRNFLAVILNHDRMEGVEEIVGSYREMVRRELGIEEVTFTTARPLSEQERQAVLERIGAETGSKFEASFREDPALVGGAILQIGSTVYDGSIRGRLQGLKERLLQQ
jgi:F-type H+-transporting ATPase subunit delta